MPFLSDKHISPCPVCRQPTRDCDGHTPEVWAMQVDIDRLTFLSSGLFEAGQPARDTSRAHHKHRS